jgi:hemerythrin superfamily protein
MNGIDVLKKDHRLVEQLFAEFLQAEDSEEERERIFQQIETELSAHTEAEEKVFYPAVQAEIPDQVDEALQEHMGVSELLAELLEMEFEDEEFDTKFVAMMKAVQQHVEQEEREGGIMDVAERTLSKELLASMANEIQTVKQDIEGEMAA